MLLNNMCESFNACIVEAREKPILTMLEKIRVWLMERIHRQRDSIKKYKWTICPRIQKRFEDIKVESVAFIAKWNGDDKFEVVGMSGEQKTVNIQDKTCSCRKWGLTGIPCKHVVFALNFLGLSAEDYFSDWCKVETFLRCYNQLMSPINGKEMWTKCGYANLLPPAISLRLVGQRRWEGGRLMNMWMVSSWKGNTKL